jgi:integrase
MAGTVRHAQIESRARRARLKPGRQPHWQAIIPGKVHLGYQRNKGEREGRWLFRRWLGDNKYHVLTLGRADDERTADGIHILTYEQAQAKARELVDIPAGKVYRLTVRQALHKYIEYKRALGQSVAEARSRGTAHILPLLGNLVVSELDAETLRRWLADLAAAPAQTRPKNGQAQYRPAPKTDDEKRARKASANRVLKILKAALNHAYYEGHVGHRDAWGLKLKLFRGVDAARVRYLTLAEAQRLVNACDPDFRALVRGALETGCRYSELTRLEVHDFNADVGTVTVRKSKNSKARHVVLTEQGAAFFRQMCAGRAGDALIFVKANCEAWQASQQNARMHEANARAQLKPPITFHGLRHTWASHAVMNGVPMIVVGKNLGHADTNMVEKHYGHLAPSFINEAIRAGAPKYNIKADKRVVALR